MARPTGVEPVISLDDCVNYTGPLSAVTQIGCVMYSGITYRHEAVWIGLTKGLPLIVHDMNRPCQLMESWVEHFVVVL